jgi:hypothetical protein
LLARGFLLLTKLLQVRAPNGYLPLVLHSPLMERLAVTSGPFHGVLLNLN